MKRMIKQIGRGIGVLMLGLVGCESSPAPVADTQPLKAFYYPLAELKDGLVYEYVNDSTQSIDHYWFFKTVEDEAGNWFLVSTRYNRGFVQDQLIRERVYANGTACEDYRFFVRDSAGHDVAYPCVVSASTMYPFEIPNDSVMVYRFQMTFFLPPDVTMRYRFTRDRRFVRLDELPIDGKATKVAVFDNLDFIALSDSVKGGHWNIDSSRVREVYAQGVGLVQLAKQMPSGQVNSIRLRARYPMDSFVVKAKGIF